MLQSLMNALGEANQRIAELESSLSRAERNASLHQIEQSQLTTINSAVHESIYMLLSSVKHDEDFMCELIKRYADPEMLKDMLSDSLFDDADELYDYMQKQNWDREIAERLKDDGLIEITDDDVNDWLRDNARYSGFDILEMVMEHVQVDKVLEAAWSGTPIDEQLTWLSDQLSELSDYQFRRVITTYGE